MSIPEMSGALFFSKEQPEIQGYLVINGIHFEIAGWRPSLIRADITARRINDEHGAKGESECDPA